MRSNNEKKFLIIQALMVLSNSNNSGHTAALFLYRMVDSPINQRDIINVIYSLICACIFSSTLYVMLTKRPRM